jgi:hypothetical protein
VEEAYVPPVQTSLEVNLEKEHVPEHVPEPVPAPAHVPEVHYSAWDASRYVVPFTID